MNSRKILILLALTVTCSTINGNAASNIHEDLALNALLDNYPTNQYGDSARLMHRLHNLIQKLSYKGNGMQRPESEKEISASDSNESQDRNSVGDHIKEVTSSRYSKREHDHTSTNSEVVAKKHDEPGLYPFKKSDNGESDIQRWYQFASKKANIDQRLYLPKKEDQNTHWHPFKRENSNNHRSPGLFPFKRQNNQGYWYPFKRTNHQNKRYSETEGNPFGYPFKRASTGAN